MVSSFFTATSFSLLTLITSNFNSSPQTTSTCPTTTKWQQHEHEGLVTHRLLSPRCVSFVILFLYTLLMNITDRLRQTKEKDNRVSMKLLNPRVCFFCTFIYSTYFLSSTAALYTTTSATTADYDDHDKRLETHRVSSPLVFSHFNPHSYYHIDASGCDCQYQQQHTTSGATVGALFFPSFRLLFAHIFGFFSRIYLGLDN